MEKYETKLVPFTFSKFFEKKNSEGRTQSKKIIETWESRFKEESTQRLKAAKSVNWRSKC